MRRSYDANNDKMKLANVSSLPEGLEVQFSDNTDPLLYSWFWLRDHGVDSDSLDPDTLQRKVNTFAIPSDLAPRNIDVDQSRTLIHIDWVDGSSTSMSVDVLSGVEGRTPQPHELVPYKGCNVWDSESPLNDMPTVAFPKVMSCEKSLLEWLENIASYGFSIVDEVPSSDQETDSLAERLGPVQQTLFGRMWHLSAELVDHGDSAYSTQYLEPHTDGTYYHDAPGLQMFNCQEFDGKGGESVLVDGFAIARRMQRDDPEAYETLCEIRVPGHYLEPGVHVRGERPVFQLNDSQQVQQVSFNNYDRAPMRLPPDQEQKFYRAYSLFHEYANDQKNWIKIPLRPGKTLIFDNWRVLHGRMGYVGKRVFYGCYHSRATFESRLRTLQHNQKLDIS